MDSEDAIIPARSEREAMDWSLVLVSQGIESLIQRASEEHGWQLVVAPPDHQRALESLRQYRRENRHDLWRRYLPRSGLIFDWRSTVWFLLLTITFALSETRFDSLRAAGMMDNRAVWAGEWWRLFTATTLHADLSHLAANVTAGTLLLGAAMGAYGPGVGLLAACLAGAGGNLAGLFLYRGAHLGLGASGMVMGALGLITAQSIAFLRAGLSARQIVARAFMGGALLLVFWGFSPDTDVIAHLGGFLSGVFLGALLALLPAKLLHHRWSNRGAVLLCAGLMLWAWERALS